MRFRFLAPLALVVLTPSLSLTAQGIDRARFTQFVDSLAAASLNGGKSAAGMTVGVMRGADTVLLKAYGFADLEFDVPTPPDAIYEIGSVTKQFTASAILQLRDAGKLALDDDLSRHLPKYPLQGRQVSIRQLLNHTSGIKGYTEIPEVMALSTRPFSADSIIAMFSAKPFDFEPGEAEIYNNSAFFLLGRIIEQLSGKSYADYVKGELFERAGMKRSLYCDEQTIQKGRTHGYDFSPKGIVVKSFIDQSWPYAAGSLCSTVGDLLAWNRALHGGRVLSSQAYRDLISPGRLKDGTPIRYGLGIALTPIAGHRSIHHGGGINGYLSQSAYFPDDDVTMVVLINTAGPVSPDGIVEKMAQRLLGETKTKGVALDHPPADYLGVYVGASRGRAMTATVERDSAGMLRISGMGGPPASFATYLGGDVFERGAMRAIFVRDQGKVARLRLDMGFGHYVLNRAP